MGDTAKWASDNFLPSNEESSNVFHYNYKEDEILNEVLEYIQGTYSQHYAKEQNAIQLQDYFNEIGIVEEFCKGSAIKYIVRYGKKNGKNPKDLLKSIHYMILLYFYSIKKDT